MERSILAKDSDFRIPKAETRLKGMPQSGRLVPEIRVLIQNPDDEKKESVRLMISENPYHWRFESG